MPVATTTPDTTRWGTPPISSNRILYVKMIFMNIVFFLTGVFFFAPWLTLRKTWKIQAVRQFRFINSQMNLADVVKTIFLFTAPRAFKFMVIVNIQFQYSGSSFTDFGSNSRYNVLRKNFDFHLVAIYVCRWIIKSWPIRQGNIQIFRRR